MADPTDLRERIIDFTADYYSQNSKVPPISAIKINFSISNTDFYKAFPDGIGELCKSCNLCIPERVAQTAHAVKARTAEKTERKSSSSSTDVPESIIPRMTLTEIQSQRLLGLSYLEGGKDPLAIMDEMLNSDADRRKNYGLSFSDESIVHKFVTSALSRGLWIDSHELVQFISKAYQYRIDELPPAAAFSLIQLAKEATDLKWNISQFVDELTRSYSMANIYRRYRRGAVSPKSAIQDLKALTE